MELNKVWILYYEETSDEGTEYDLIEVCATEEAINKRLGPIKEIHEEWDIYTSFDEEQMTWQDYMNVADDMRELWEEAFNEICGDTNAWMRTYDYYYYKEVEVYV